MTRALAPATNRGHRGEPPPRAGSKSPVPSGGSAVPGRNAQGTISINDSVVAKLAARATLDNPHAGAAASTVLGLTLPGAALLGTKDTDLEALPKCSATVDGAVATVELTISVRWPNSVAKVASEVRDLVRSRVHELTGLKVTEVRIDVTDLATTGPPRQRVS
ncbi:MAG: Asp23/Gls24 family envelope stress response protein [Antricoccus sp.]